METARIGPYRLEAELGVGGMGKVYRAFDQRLERAVAIKQVSRPIARRGHERERLWREARAVAQLSHPAVVQIFDIVEDHAGDWIVMELVEGRTLTRLLEDGPLGVRVALPIFRDVAEALAEAHAKGILHRDLKSDNVMLTAAGHTKLLDFGLARPIEPGEDDRLTVEGRIVGTPYAMSPEQAMAGPLDHRSDLFSLGTLLYETLTGERPFRGADMVATLHSVCTDWQRPARELNPRVPRELSQLVDWLLEKDPENRPEETSVVAQALRRLAGAHPEAGRRNGEPPAGRHLDNEPPTVAAVPVGRRRAGGRDAGRRDAPSSAPSAERRQMTVVHCELASTRTPSGVLDPEELIEVRPELHRLAAAVAERYGGAVGEALDHGLRILFGFPRAHEDDARRAVYAARELAAVAGELGGIGTVALKVGVHTGPAVVAGADVPQLVLGETASTAGGVASLAPPGAVLLSATTREIVAPFVRTRALAPARVPGLARPIVAHRFLRDAERGTGAIVPRTPMVARRQELNLMLDRWQLVEEGTGQVVFLGGEAGIGKSRLVQAVRERLADKPIRWLDCQGSPFALNTPFAPIIELLRRLMGTGGGPPSLDALRAVVRSRGGGLSEAVPVLASLLAIPTSASGGKVEPARRSPQVERQRTLETLAAMFQEMAEDRPVLWVVEDLHWVDPSTLELLELLVDRAQGVPMLLLLTSRPGFQPSWSEGSHTTKLTLGRLNRRQTGNLIRLLTGDRRLAPGIMAVIVERTDGIPLFVEEVTKAVLETPVPKETSSGAWRTASGSYLPVEVPATLRDLLAARLDRLGTAKAVAQRASALGRTFGLELLAAVAALEQKQLAAELERLVEAELIFRKGYGRNTRYTFKHALIQDAAYQSLLRSERRKLHHSIARALAGRFAKLAEGHPELLAHHYSEAGEPAEAIPLWLQAGREASERAATAEAVAHLSRGLELLETLPATPERDARELDFRIALGLSWMAVEGYAATAGESNFRRARELCRESPEDPRYPFVLSGLFIYHLTRAEHSSACALAEELLHLAEERSDTDLLLDAHRIYGSSALSLGDLETARRHFDRGLELQRRKDPSYDVLTPSDPGVNCHLMGAWVSWLTGHPERALRESREGLALARRIDHPYSLAMAYCLAAEIHLFRREPAAGLELAEAAIALSEEQGFTYWRIVAGTLRGAARALEGLEEGSAELRHALDAQRAQGMRMNRPRFLCLLAETCSESEVPEGLAAMAEAQAAIEDTGERHFAPEVHRLQGELLSRAPTGSGAARQKAEGCFQQALEEARRQGARSLELRAAVSLARLWRDTGRRAEARQLLGEVYGGFTGGFDTADLKEAGELLEEVTSHPMAEPP